MKVFDLVLLPHVKDRVQGYLDVDVRHLSFTSGTNNSVTPTAAIANHNDNSTHIRSSRKNRNHTKSRNATKSAKNVWCPQEDILKFFWWSECLESSSSLRIIGDVHATQQSDQIYFKCCRKGGQLQSLTQHQQILRHKVRTSLALFLDYLHSCEPIEIAVTTTNSKTNCHISDFCASVNKPLLSRAHIRLTGVVLRKATGYSSGCPFKHTTKIYALYRNGGTKSVLPKESLQLQLQQQLKTGEIQLRFRMLFAACTSATAKPLQHIAHASNTLGQQQLTTLQKLKDQLAASSPSVMPAPTPMSPQRQIGSAAAKGNECASTAVVAELASEEAKEAMRKLDAKLVAYLAGETMLQSETELELSSKNDTGVIGNGVVLDKLQEIVNDTVENAFTEEQLQLYKRIKSVKLQMEAITLGPEGTKRMELLHNEIRPIFTVECQLSHELIKHVERYDMFHIMQFESEKFHSLTQCTRFGQEAQRDINLQPLIDDIVCKTARNASAMDIRFFNLGRIHFTVWWREPGTCLNEMLGIGVLELRELYDAALLEQCKCITVQRRGVTLANIYLKIKLLLPSSSINNNATITNHVKQPKPCFGSVNSDTNNNNNNNNNGIINGIGGEEASIKQLSGGDNPPDNANAPDSTINTTATASASPAATTITSSNITAADTTTKENKDSRIAISNSFNAETLKIRLLTGFAYACEVRNLPMCENREYHLICNRFWKAEPASAKAEGIQRFYYQEQFAVIRDAQFLNRVMRKHLKLEIWQRPVSAANVDNNGNAHAGLELIGVVLLPLHKFFIAFSNEMMANRLITEQLPVISIDAWVPIMSPTSQSQLGELKCLLAIGSEEQINNLKTARGFCPLHSDMFTSVGNASALEQLHPTTASLPPMQEAILYGPGAKDKPKTTHHTVNLMQMLQHALHSTAASTAQASSPDAVAAGEATPSRPALATEAVTYLQERTFQFELFIACATALLPHPAAKGKSGKHAAKRAASKRFPPGEAPTTYVTFQADACLGSSGHYKSHEGKVYATEVIERSTHPRYAQRFLVTVGAEYLETPQHNFILKLWKKANVPPGNGNGASTSTRLLPRPIDDAIIGFTALDLSAFLRGMHLGGFFNVVDFNGRINGQLELNAKPLVGWYERYVAQQTWQPVSQPPHQRPQQLTTSMSTPSLTATPANIVQGAAGAAVDNVIEQFENSLDLTHLNLGQAIKHKLNELEGISKRLRTRLGILTGEQLPQQFDMAQLDSWRSWEDVVAAEAAIDNELDEFERDINTNAFTAVEAEENDTAEGKVTEAPIEDDKSDKKAELISKTAPGTAEPAVD